MPLQAPAPTYKPRPLCPAGPTQAVCVDVVQLQPKANRDGVLKDRIGIVFQVPFQDEEGYLLSIYNRFNFTMNEKSYLRAFIQTWLNAQMSDEQATTFDFETLIGYNAYLTIVHEAAKDGSGRTFANVQAAMPWPAQFGAPMTAVGYRRVCERPNYQPPVMAAQAQEPDGFQQAPQQYPPQQQYQPPAAAPAAYAPAPQQYAPQATAPVQYASPPMQPAPTQAAPTPQRQPMQAPGAVPQTGHPLQLLQAQAVQEGWGVNPNGTINVARIRAELAQQGFREELTHANIQAAFHALRRHYVNANAPVAPPALQPAYAGPAQVAPMQPAPAQVAPITDNRAWDGGEGHRAQVLAQQQSDGMNEAALLDHDPFADES